MDQRATCPRVSDKKKHLRPPELDVILPRVEEKQILAHLMEDEGLADVAPVFLLCRRREMKQDNERDAGGD